MKNIDKILIVGSGYMAKEYLKVIQSMNLLKKTEIFSKSNKNYENIFKLFQLKLGFFKNQPSIFIS